MLLYIVEQFMSTGHSAASSVFCKILLMWKILSRSICIYSGKQPFGLLSVRHIFMEDNTAVVIEVSAHVATEQVIEVN